MRFWFATGGAGFCLSRGLALKMKPWAGGGAFMETAERISLPDDCTVGYIANALLGASLVRSPFFHSHLEDLGQVSDVRSQVRHACRGPPAPQEFPPSPVPSSPVLLQVTLSYGTSETGRNTVTLPGPFPIKDDPTR